MMFEREEKKKKTRDIPQSPPRLQPSTQRKYHPTMGEGGGGDASPLCRRVRWELMSRANVAHNLA